MSHEREMPVFLVEYDERWPRLFAEERDRLRATLGPGILGIEHIGSTAIPEMLAKPVIDIMVLIGDISTAPSYLEALGTLDYHYFPYAEDRTPERRWYCKPNLQVRTHHLHLVQARTAFHLDHVLFRDYLIHHPRQAARYQILKQQLVERYNDDREAYTEGKTEFVCDMVRRARQWTGYRQPIPPVGLERRSEPRGER